MHKKKNARDWKIKTLLQHHESLIQATPNNKLDGKRIKSKIPSLLSTSQQKLSPNEMSAPPYCPKSWLPNPATPPIYRALQKRPKCPYTRRYNTSPRRGVLVNTSFSSSSGHASTGPCLPPTQAPRSRRVSPASKLLDALRAPRSNRLGDPVRPPWAVRPPLPSG
jgi:hypothetical protein